MNNQVEQPLVSIIIPYYQKENGLLSAAVESIVKQTGYTNYEVIVVDDGSPISAKTELEDLLGVSKKIKIIEQENAGPGAARNKGLENITSETSYIAFMDSDDCWENCFLHVAVGTLEAGYDLFFSNSAREGVEGTRFEWDSEKNLDLKPEQHLLIDESEKTYEFNGDFFDYTIVRSNILSTSATIYRRSCYPDLRFNTDLFNGQDRLFKLSLSQKINKIAFSSKILVKEFKGLNIFSSAMWGTTKSLVLLGNYINLSKTIIQDLSLNEKHNRIIEDQLNESRHSFIASLLHLIKIKEKIDWAFVSKIIRQDPALLVKAIPSLINIFSQKINKASG